MGKRLLRTSLRKLLKMVLKRVGLVTFRKGITFVDG
jgi:hypothetical protein